VIATRMNSLRRIYSQPVILSREDGEGSLTISAATQHRAEMIRDGKPGLADFVGCVTASTPLRSAQNDSF